jgi:hypothetical protein
MAHPSKHRDVSPPPSNPIGILVVIILILIFVGLALLARFTQPAESPQQFAQSVSLDASVDSSIAVVGTLAPLGSFEYETSPLTNRMAVLLRHAGDAYLRHEISRDQASEVKAESESAYAIIAQATRVCDPVPHTGKCQAPRKEVDELLEDARVGVAAIPDYQSGVSFKGR